MKNIDLLDKLYRSNITIDQAYDIKDNVLDSDTENEPHEILMMSEIEWTAVCHAAPLDVIAKWRHEGWPTRCVNTGEPIEVEKYGWIVVSNNGVYGLKLVTPQASQ
jgi:hypothetical protein